MKGMPFTMYGVSASLLSQTRIHTKFIVSEAHFNTDSIAASHVVIARKTAKLFKILYSLIQRGPTIAPLMLLEKLQPIARVVTIWRDSQICHGTCSYNYKCL